MGNDEDDIPTKKETEGEGSRFQTENENCRRKKGIGCKKIKRKKKIISIGHIYVVFSSIQGSFMEEEGRSFMKFSDSLKKNTDFQNVYKNGRSYANRLLVMYVLANQSGQNRFGISVSKKVGNSVIRHRVTRLIRESYRLQEDMFDSGLDIVVIARAAARGRSYHEIESALMHLGGLHKIICSDSVNL